MALEKGKTSGYLVAILGLFETLMPFFTAIANSALVMFMGILTILGGLGMASGYKWGYVLAFLSAFGLTVVSFTVSYNMLALVIALILLFYLIYVAKDYGFAKRINRVAPEAHYIADAQRVHSHYVED